MTFYRAYFSKTILASAMALMLGTPAHANLSNAISAPIAKVANLFGFGDDSGNDDDMLSVHETPNLDVLEAKPNPLHGIDGLHHGRVPLGAVSPNTLKTFVSVVDLVRRDYVEEVGDEALFRYAIKGMMTGLDSHAEFLDKEAFNNLQSFTSGHVANIGISASYQTLEAHWVVTQVEEGSSAKRAGIRVGDYLHQIGDTKLGESQSSSDVLQLLNGIAGTQVDVIISNAGRNKRRLSVQRNEVIKSSIETTIIDGVAVIKLPVFLNNTRQQILESLGSAGVPISGVILDLRNNPGGVLESAGAVASLFMRNQTVVQVAGRQGVERELKTEGSPLLIELPVMILQNRYSASAAEVLASSLQSSKRAIVVGETSYGKGSVQSVIPLGDGQAVKMTTAHYLTADGKQIDGVGVIPDVSLDDKPHQITNDGTMDVAEHDDVWLSWAVALMDGAKLDVGIDFAPVGGF